MKADLCRRARQVWKRRYQNMALIAFALFGLFGNISVASALDGPSKETESTSSLGFKKGPFLFRPSLFADTTFNSNVFLQDPSELQSGESLTSAWSLVTGGTLDVSTPSPSGLDLLGSLRFAWEQYLSGDNQLFDQSGLEVDFNTGLTINPQGSVAWRPHLSYNRTNSPQFSVSAQSYNENIINPGIEMIIQPSQGKVLSQRLGYDFTYYLMDQVEDINRQLHHIKSFTRWNFLFQTALVLEIQETLVIYSQRDRTVLGDNSASFELENIDSTPFRVTLGLSSLLGNRIDLQVRAGYGYTFYSEGTNEHVPLISASLGYKWTDNSYVRLGYTKEFSDTTLGNFYLFHKVYLQWSKRFVERFQTSLKASLDTRTYQGVTGLDARSDIVVNLNTSIAYNFVESLTLGLRYDLELDETDFGVNLQSPDGSTVRALAAYTKHVLFLNAAYHF